MNLAISIAPTPLAAIQASRRRNGLAMLGIHSGHADGPLGRRRQGPQAPAEQLLLATARLYGRLRRVWPASLRAVFTCTGDHRPADPGRMRNAFNRERARPELAAAPIVATPTTPGDGGSDPGDTRDRDQPKTCGQLNGRPIQEDPERGRRAGRRVKGRRNIVGVVSM
jgi:hypothetical protein